MKKKLAALAVAVALVGGTAVPAVAHTIEGHSCASQHGWKSDGLNKRHSALRVTLSTTHYALITGQHFITGDGLNKWITFESYATSSCPNT